VPSYDAALEASSTRVTQVAILRRPGDLPVVTHSTELAIDDLFHRDLVGARTHLEAQLVVTDLASISDSVEPVGKDDGANAFLLRLPIDDYVSILADSGSRQHDR
jgi:hypothetical protein